VTAVGGVQVPVPTVQVTVTVVVPDWLHVPVACADAASGITLVTATDAKPPPRATAAPITAMRRAPK
jgi:hypothetical protein